MQPYRLETEETIEPVSVISEGIECSVSTISGHDNSITPPSSNYKRSDKRRDILFKTLLRKIKKDFKADFYNKTEYDRTKRSKSPVHFYNCLRSYVKRIFRGEKDIADTHVDEICFNLGTLKLYAN